MKITTLREFFEICPNCLVCGKKLSLFFNKHEIKYFDHTKTEELVLMINGKYYSFDLNSNIDAKMADTLCMYNDLAQTCKTCNCKKTFYYTNLFSKNKHLVLHISFDFTLEKNVVIIKHGYNNFLSVKMNNDYNCYYIDVDDKWYFLNYKEFKKRIKEYISVFILLS